MKGSLFDGVAVLQAIKPDAYAATTTNSTGVDITPYDELLIVLSAGTAGTSNDVKVQHSVDNSTWADVTGAVFTQLTTSNDDTVYLGRLSCRPLRKWVRVVAVTVGAANDFAVLILGGASRQWPVSQSNSAEFDIVNV